MATLTNKLPWYQRIILHIVLMLNNNNVGRLAPETLIPHMSLFGTHVYSILVKIMATLPASVSDITKPYLTGMIYGPEIAGDSKSRLYLALLSINPDSLEGVPNKEIGKCILACMLKEGFISKSIIRTNNELTKLLGYKRGTNLEQQVQIVLNKWHMLDN